MCSKMIVTILGISSIFLSSILKINGNTVDNSVNDGEMILYDFTKNATAENWVEQSDTVREVGQSKAALTIQKTQIFRRAIFFTLLHPQPNGACFAGMRTMTALNLANFNYLSLKVRGEGQNYNYKIVLRHKNQDNEPYPTYEQFFTVPKVIFETITLPFSDFKPYYRGEQLNDTEPLDKSNITSIGIQVYGGVYLPIKQYGTSSLEIDWIKVME